MTVILGIIAALAVLGMLLEVNRRLWRRSRAVEVSPAPKCQHENLIDVESGGQIVAYICADCDEQVDVNAPAATRHRVRNRVETGFSDMVQSLNEDKAELQRTIDASRRQIDEQARLFAARTQQFEQGGHIPPATYVNVMPDLSNFKGRM